MSILRFCVIITIFLVSVFESPSIFMVRYQLNFRYIDSCQLILGGLTKNGETVTLPTIEFKKAKGYRAFIEP